MTVPRFLWWQHSAGIPLWYVFDSRPEQGEPGQLIEVSTCRTREAAVMTCMALNGS
jgi:hypothetical protein